VPGRWTTDGGGGRRAVGAPGRLVGAAKGSTGCVAAWHAKAEEEKGVGWGSAQRAGTEKRGGGVWWLDVVWRRRAGGLATGKARGLWWPIRHLPCEAGERLGGGPRVAAEDKGLSVLLGGQSARAKGSTGRAAAWHTEEEEEKGVRWGVGSARGEGEKRGGGVRWLGIAWWRRAWGGGGLRQARRVADGGRSGICRAKQGSGWRVWAVHEGVGRPGRRRELGRA
jgi:hypothetical protein